jgi:hypothetical protein
MTQALDGVTSDIEQLCERVRELERRVSALESHPEKFIPPTPAVTNLALQRPRPPPRGEDFPRPQFPAERCPY